MSGRMRGVNNSSRWRQWPVLCGLLLLWPLLVAAEDDCLQLAELCRGSCPRLPLAGDDSLCSSHCASALAECVDSGQWPANERPLASQPSAEELNVSILQWRDERRPQLLEQQARFAELRDLFELLPEPAVGQRFIHPHLTLVLTAGGELVQLDVIDRQLRQRQRLADECEQLSFGPPPAVSPPVATAAANSTATTSSKAAVMPPPWPDLALLCSAAAVRQWRWQQSPEPARQRSANWTTKGLLLWQAVPAGWQLQLLAHGATASQPLWLLPASSDEPVVIGAAADGQWVVFAQNEMFGLLRSGQTQPQPLAAEQLLVDEQQRLLQIEGDSLLLDRLTASGSERLYRRRLPVAEQSMLVALPGSDQLLLAHVDATQDAWLLTLYDHQQGLVLGSGPLADLSPFELPAAQVSEDGSRVYLALGDERWLEIDPQRLRPDEPVAAEVEAGATPETAIPATPAQPAPVASSSAATPAAAPAAPAPAAAPAAAPVTPAPPVPVTPATPRPAVTPTQPAAPVDEPRIAG